MSKTLKVDEEFYDLIGVTADELDTTQKAVLNMILEWFFSSKGGGGQLDVDAVDEDDEDEDDEE